MASNKQSIAIIGMSGRFPGAQNIDQLWQNLLNGVESIRPFTDEELTAAGITQKQRRAEQFVNAGAVMDDPDKFDAAFFGFTPREAELIDPQHRIFLECAWSSLEHAGYNPAGIDVPVGVFGGVASNTYYINNVSTQTELLAKQGGYTDLVSREREFAITRIAYKLNLTGPAVSINTACSTSGVSIHLAIQSLLNDDCQMALAGGARLKVPFGGYDYVENGILSPDGHCRTFSDDAAGTVIGNGVATLVLKKLDAALADGDTVHAVIIGSAINNDGGDKVGYTAPSINGQAEVIRAALASAEIDPETIGYIEAHGTGTAIGDPIEIAGLTRAWRDQTTESSYCAIGSIKSNIGHLDAAAGIAGIIKTVLALKHNTIPPSLNFAAPNPQIDFDNSPFYVADEPIPWESYGEPRRAGVSMFGLGGTNAHILLEEAPQQVPTLAADDEEQLLVLSAMSDTAVRQQADNLADYLTANQPNLADVAWTLKTGRKQFSHRIAVPATASTAVESLRKATQSGGMISAENRSVAFMFAGGGAQYIGMAQGLYDSAPIFRDAVDQCADLLLPQLNLDIRDLLYGETSKEFELERPCLALPTLFTIQYASAQLWQSLGIRPDTLIGHSMGEYTAACLSGVFTLEDALAIVFLRGRLFETTEEGGMLSVPLSEEELQPLVNGHLSFAAINKPDACVISGESAAISALQTKLNKRNVQSRRLRITVAAHSALVEPILSEFESYLQSVTFSEPTIPFISNLTGEWALPEQVTKPAYWVRHLRDTVRFSDGLTTLLEQPNYTLLEIGPGQVLSSLARQHPAKQSDHTVVASMRHPKETTPDHAFMLASLGKLWQSGVAVDWQALHDGNRRRVPLPTYPFERKRYWIERREPEGGQLPADAVGLTQPDEIIATAEAPMSTAPSPAPAPIAVMPRREQIVAKILTVVEDLTGYLPHEVDQYATFLELGFDSLLLTQANTAFGQAFKVKITFRQLFEDAPGVAALADYVDAQMPANAQLPGATAPVAVQQTIATQGVPAASAPVQVVHLNQESAAADEPVQKDKGPWKPLNTSAASSLTMRQQQALDLLIERLTTKHAKSKALTEANRPTLADPRTVAGFRRTWKELVFPIHVERSEGSKFYDVDGNELLDMVMGFGVALYGHRPPFIMQALEEQMARGIEIGPQTTLTGEAADLVCELTGMDRAGFCNTGSEAVLATMRTARTVTGRQKIVTFVGDYHGIFDEVLPKRIGAPGRERIIPRAPGIPQHMVQDIILLDYGDPNAISKIIARADEIAAVLVEPVQSRNPTLQPREFLHKLREITTKHDIALIFDEMITGFRATPSGAQGHFGVKADIASYGKAVAGGMPIGVVAGSAKYMDALDGGAWQFGDDSVPEIGVTWFAGTFVRHPLAMAAVKASLTHIKEQGPQLQADLNAKTAKLVSDFNAFCIEVNAPVRLEHFSSWILLAWNGHQEFESIFYQYLRDHRIHITEGRPAFLSTAHSEADIAEVLRAFKRSVGAMVAGDFFEGNLDVVKRHFPDLYATVGADAEWQYRVPLTPAQQELWLAAQQSEAANCVYNIPARLHLRGNLDKALLQESVQQLVERHEGLRTTFSADGQTYCVSESLRIDVPLIDLSNLNADERAEQFSMLQEAEAHTPFDLEHGPLVRASIISLSSDEHFLFLTGHHIIFDGWSSAVVLGELGELYAAAIENRPNILPIPMQFSDFAAWQKAQLKEESYADAEAYWLGQFAEPAPYFELPSDRPRPALKTFATNRLDLTVGADLLTQLRKVGAKQGTTLFATLLAGFKTLLYRLSGEDDITLAVAAAWQPLAGGDNLVADGVNLLPLRSKIDATTSFNEFLKQIRNTVLDGFEHQEYVFGSLLRQLNLPRDLSRNPLVSVFFNLDPEVGALDFGGGVSAEFGSNTRRFENFDIFYNIVILPDGLRMECTYNTALYDGDTIERWHDAYHMLLSSACEEPTNTLGMLSLLSSAEKHKMLVEWNDTATPLPEATVIELFDQQAAATPETVALIQAEETLSYQSLQLRANQLANYLVEQGVQAGTPVGIALPRGFDMIVSLLATLKAGGIYVPLDPSYPQERLALILEDAAAVAVLTHSDLIDTLPTRDGLKLIAVDRDQEQIAAHANTAPASDSTPDSPMYITYTSGSTGRPKGVIGHHRGVINRCQWQWNSYPFTEGEVTVQKTTLNFVDSLWEIWGPLLAGVPSVLIPDDVVKDTDRLLDLLASHAIQRIVLVPSMVRVLLENYPDLQSRLPNLKYWTVSGESLSSTLSEQFKQQLPNAILLNLYGMSEAVADVTFHDSRLDISASGVPIGKPIHNMQVYVLDQDQQPQPVGVVGELYIGGKGLAHGYHGQPNLTDERFVANPFSQNENDKLYRTGDMARWLPSGVLEYVGRTDNQVKIRGIRVELGEVEAALRGHSNVREVMTLARADEGNHATLDQRIVAYVIGDITKDALRQYAKAHLPSAMIPSDIVVLDAFPLMPNGKVDRLALLSLDSAEIVQSSKTIAPPTTPLEHQIAQLWQKALKIRKIGINEDFFDLGGHSLTALSILPQLSEIANKQLPLNVLFNAPTIAKLAQAMAKDSGEQSWTSLVPLKPEGSKRPFFYVTSYLESTLAYTRLTRHFDPDRPLYGIQAQGLDGLLPTHDSLPQMAAHYIKEIKTVQVEGPYQIGGHCSGGWVAYEIVNQLQAMGDKVSFFGVVDSPPPHLHPPKTNLVANTTERLGYYLRERRLLHALAWQYQLNVQSRYTYKMGNGLAKQIAKVRKQYEDAMVAYRERLITTNDPGYNGGVNIFRSSEYSAFEQKDWHLRWRELVTGPVAVQSIDSTHATLLHEPQVEHLAAKICSVLNDVEERLKEVA